MGLLLMWIGLNVILDWHKGEMTLNAGTRKMCGKTLLLLSALSALFLSGCVTTSVRDDSHASDLDALVANAKRDLRKTLLPNGKEYCAEDSVTDKQKDSCTADLEDGLFNSNKDKALGLKNILKAVARLKLARDPCRWYEFSCKRSARQLDAED